MTWTRLDVLVHELRSPVAALVAIADAYRDADEPTRRRLVELARTAGVSLDRLLADVSATTLRLSRVDLDGIARDATEAANLERHSVVTVAEGGGGAVIVGDAERLRQALDNLIGNAIGHSPDGATVTVTTRSSGGSVVVEVADRGEGIASADLERIFEQGVRATSARPGSGLGLAVVRRDRTRARGRGRGRVEPRSGGDVQARAAGRFRRVVTPSSA